MGPILPCRCDINVSAVLFSLEEQGSSVSISVGLGIEGLLV